jgi:hypothetical protein
MASSKEKIRLLFKDFLLTLSNDAPVITGNKIVFHHCSIFIH